MLESYYLEETMNTGNIKKKKFKGNIIKGWEGYLINKIVKPAVIPQIKKPKITPNDRIFSLSSTTSPAVFFIFFY
jgi:hypothetical protein